MDLSLGAVLAVALLHMAGYGVAVYLLVRTIKRKRQKALKEGRPRRPWWHYLTNGHVVAHLLLLTAAVAEVSVVVTIEIPHGVAKQAGQVA